jgi:hypothetical protein
MQLSGWSLLVSVFAFGCSGATAPSTQARVVVTAETVVASVTSGGSVEWLGFSVPASVTNTGPDAIELGLCGGASVEQLVDGEWQRVWSPICVLSAGATATPIAPGETRAFSVIVSAALSGNGGPRWESGAVNATHRLAVAIRSVEERRSFGTVLSNSFELRTQ